MWLLRMECKQSPNMSWVLWIPTIWVLAMSSKPLGVWFQSGADAEGGSPLDRIFISTILLISFIILAGKMKDRQKIIKNNLSLFLLIIYMLISVVWSAMPYISFKRWVREMPVIVMALIILTEENPWNALESLFRRIIYILMPFSLLLIKYYTYLGVEYSISSGGLMWIGVTTQKNSFAGLCLFSAFFIIWTLFKRRLISEQSIHTKYQSFIEIFILGLSLYLMGGPNHNLSYSATANIVFTIGLLSLCGFYFMKKWNIKIGQTALVIATTFIIIYGIITPFLGGLSIIDPSAAMGREDNLTGRTEIWATLIPYAMQRPIWGYGYGGFWTPEIKAITSTHAHNGYLDIIIDLGVIGLGFFYIFLISCCRKAYSLMLRNYQWGIFFLCILFMNIIYNIAETTLHILSCRMTATLIFLFIISNLELPTPNPQENAILT
jgi:O-antigen ligase